MVRTVILVFSFALILELAGGLIFETYFLFKGYMANWQDAYYFGFFHALSSYTNAGFDIFGEWFASGYSKKENYHLPEEKVIIG